MTHSMRAMQIRKLGPIGATSPLVSCLVPVPVPEPGEVLIEVQVCAVCHTELDEIEGRTPPQHLPRIPGHQVVGRIVQVGKDVPATWLHERVGVAWIFSACGQCPWCQRGEENLCPVFIGCGRDRDGGYAEFMTAPAAFVHRIPAELADAAAAPMLCAGAIGWRSLKLTQLVNGETLGLTGFGAANHLVLKLAQALYPDSRVVVWARNAAQRNLARSLGACWTGDTHERPPEFPQAIIDATPVYATVLAALEWLAPGGRLVINAIRKETADLDLLAQLDYGRHLWLEKEIKSVANVTRRDVREVLEHAVRFGIVPEYQCYPFARANEALLELKAGKIHGAKVLVLRQSD